MFKMTLNVHENVSHVPISVLESIPPNITSDSNVNDDRLFNVFACKS